MAKAEWPLGMRALLTRFDSNQADVLDALIWWTKGFNAAHMGGCSNAPNIIGIRDLPDAIRALVKLKNTNDDC